jgi:hypothetical protein
LTVAKEVQVFWSVYCEQTGLGNGLGFHPWIIKEGKRSNKKHKIKIVIARGT